MHLLMLVLLLMCGSSAIAQEAPQRLVQNPMEAAAVAAKSCEEAWKVHSGHKKALQLLDEEKEGPLKDYAPYRLIAARKYADLAQLHERLLKSLQLIDLRITWLLRHHPETRGILRDWKPSEPWPVEFNGCFGTPPVPAELPAPVPNPTPKQAPKHKRPTTGPSMPA